jgi:hypothetical protein
MPKFNKTATGAKIAERALEDHPAKTTNHEGGLAFKPGDQVELYLRCASTLVGEPKFYDPSAQGDWKEIPDLVAKVAQADPEYVLRLAAYCRNVLNLRSVPVMLLVEATKHANSKKFVRSYTCDIVQRPDELTEAIAYYTHVNGHIGSQSPKGMLANSLKRGLADAFHQFGAYSLAKYDRDGKVKLSDVIRIVHPKPKDDAESVLFKQVRTRTLPVPETWETVISGAGSTKENWEKVLPKMGIFAVTRNLRNLLEKDVDMTVAIELLENAEAVKKSRMFPWRFYTAYREIENSFNHNLKVGRVRDALQTAMDLSIANIPELSGSTFVVCDNSGSMDAVVSEHGTVQRREVGAVMGALAHNLSDESMVGAFGSHYATVSLSRHDGIITNAKKIRDTQVGGSTEAYLAFQHLIENRIKVDRIMFFSDMQCYNTTGYHVGQSVANLLRKYRAEVCGRTKLYSFDLAGYGTIQTPPDEQDVLLIGGWSDKVLSYIAQYEKGLKDVLEVINAIKPGQFKKQPRKKAVEED